MRILKNIILFILFGTIYFLIETIWKGHLTHWSMFILAGCIGSFIGQLNELLPWECPFIYQCFIGMVAATLGEGITGLIVNVWLKMNIWNYSNVPLHFFFGQCSLPFCAAWFLLAGVCIVIDDYIRWKFFHEEKPKYFQLRGKKL